ncbi:MAG: hypothetical protein J1F43_04690 [Muribaculaceae bacterium]|nr:hypothetical protein [Muribaculaceae bacterium]
MKKNILLAGGLLLGAAAFAATPLPQITPEYLEIVQLVNKIPTTVEVIEVSNIKSISYTKEGEKPGYTKMVVLMKDNREKIYELDNLSMVKYSPEVNEYLSLTEDFDEHCEIIILDHYYNETDDYSKHFHVSKPGEGVHYTYNVDYGYDVEFSFIGKDTGHDYYQDKGFIFEDDYTGTGAYMKSYAFLMPEESLTLKLRTKERETYQDMSFTGEYPYILWINETLENHVLTTETHGSINVKANGTVVVKTEDGNAYNFTNPYIYNEGKNELTYNRDESGKYAFEGVVLSDNYIVGDIRNLNEDKPDNTMHYFLSKVPVKYVRAANADRDGRFIIVVATDNEGSKYYSYNYHTKSISEMKADYKSGTTLGGPAVVILTMDANPFAIKYTLAEGQDAKPVIEYASIERGTYTAKDGEGDDLFLDGFCDAEWGDKTGTYTINVNQVAFTGADGSEVVFVLDMLNKSYDMIEEDTTWNGPLSFSTSNEGGKIESTASEGATYIELKLNQDFQGNFQEGNAKITMWLGGQSFIDTTSSYSYNPKENTLTIDNLYYRIYRDGNWVELQTMEFKVDNDKKTLTLDYQYITPILAGSVYAYYTGPIVLTAGE